MADIIRTLGLYQPYATLMLPPHFKIETRWVKKGRKPPFPLGYYLIYSTQKAYTWREVEAIAGQELADNACRLVYRDEANQYHGYALGVGELLQVFPFKPENEELAWVQTPDPDSERDLWMLYFGFSVRRIKPFPIKGKQGVGILSDEDRLKIEYL